MNSTSLTIGILLVLACAGFLYFVVGGPEVDQRGLLPPSRIENSSDQQSSPRPHRAPLGNSPETTVSAPFAQEATPTLDQEPEDSRLVTVDLLLLGPDGLPFSGEVLATLVPSSFPAGDAVIMAGQLLDRDKATLAETPELSFRAATADAQGHLRFRLPRRAGANEILLVARNPLGEGIDPATWSNLGAPVPFEALRLARIRLDQPDQSRVELGRVDISHKALLATGRVVSTTRDLEPTAIEISAWPKDDGLFGEKTVTLPLDERGRFRIFAGSSADVILTVTPVLRRGDGQERGPATRINPGDRNVEIALKPEGRLRGAIDLGLTPRDEVEFRLDRRDDTRSVWTPIPLGETGAFDVTLAEGLYDALVLYRGIEVGRFEEVRIVAGDEAEPTTIPYLRLAVDRTRPGELVVLDRDGRPYAGLIRVRVEEDGLQNFARSHLSDASGRLLIDLPNSAGPWRVVAETPDGQVARVAVDEFPLVLKLGRR